MADWATYDASVDLLSCREAREALKRESRLRSQSAAPPKGCFWLAVDEGMARDFLDRDPHNHVRAERYLHVSLQRAISDIDAGIPMPGMAKGPRFTGTPSEGKAIQIANMVIPPEIEYIPEPLHLDEPPARVAEGGAGDERDGENLGRWRLIAFLVVLAAVVAIGLIVR